MGLYPTQCGYDPNRPTWLPYFFDDTLESQNKAACALASGAAGPLGILAAPFVAGTTATDVYSLPPAPAPVTAPDVAVDPTGASVNIDAQIAAQMAAQLAALQAWANAQSAATPVDNSSVGGIANCLSSAVTTADYLNCLAGSGLPPGSSSIPTWAIVGGVSLLVVLVVIAGKR